MHGISLTVTSWASALKLNLVWHTGLKAFRAGVAAVLQHCTDASFALFSRTVLKTPLYFTGEQLVQRLGAKSCLLG